MADKGGGILITGGTGFLGRALTRYLLDQYQAPHAPIPAQVTGGIPGGPPKPAPIYRRICIYSRSEHAQAAMYEEFNRDPRLRMFIGDVRDRDRLQWAMESVDVVIHAAALKRIEVGHYNPGEMVKTNVDGASNVVHAARASEVRRVVGVSSDKAYQPVSPYGQTKAMMEAILLAANNTAGAYGPSFAICRYGNVAGSTGSVIPKWRAHLSKAVAYTESRPWPAQKVEITDPDCTRFWMTVDQAVGLVMAAVNGGGPILIPKLRAFDLRSLATAMGADGFTTTGLGAWEKKHESLEEGVSSDQAERMTVDDLREALKYVGPQTR